MKLTKLLGKIGALALILSPTVALADSYNFTLFNQGTQVGQRGIAMRTDANTSTSGGFALKVNRGQTFALKIGNTCYEVTPTNLDYSSAQYFFPTNNGELETALSAKNSSGQQIFVQTACSYQYTAWTTALPLSCPSNIGCGTTVTVSSERSCMQSVGDLVDCSLCGSDACYTSRTCSGGTCAGDNSDCFAAGTTVSMADGSVKKIADVKVGDEVVSFDVNAKDAILSTAKVERVQLTDSQDIYKINGGWLEANAHHALQLEDGSWKTVSDLSLGDKILMDSGETTTVSELSFSGRTELTYNLQLEDGQGFIAAGARVQGASAETASLASAK